MLRGVVPRRLLRALAPQSLCNLYHFSIITDINKASIIVGSQFLPETVTKRTFQPKCVDGAAVTTVGPSPNRICRVSAEAEAMFKGNDTKERERDDVKGFWRGRGTWTRATLQ